MSDQFESPRRSSFTSIRSRIRKSSFRSKRKSVAADDDIFDDHDTNKRWSTASDQSLPPLPPRKYPTKISSPTSASASPPEIVGEVYTVPSPTSASGTSMAGKLPGKRALSDRVDSSLPGPFQQQIPMIMYFFGATCLAILVLSWIHWTLAIVVAACSTHVLWKKLEIAGRDAQWEVEMAEARKRLADPKNEESVEWLNKTLATVWPLINSEYFAPFVDLLEDSLMTQVPGIVHSVRVEDMDQGTIPLRVKSFKVLPSDNAAFFHGAVPDREGSDDQDEKDSLVDVGEFVNLEITFAYRGVKASKGKRNAKNTSNDPSDNGAIGASPTTVEEELDDFSDAPTEKIHMLIYMSIGLQKIAAVEVPVWVEMIGIEGKMRVRLQMTPVAPFIKHAAFTFVGAPKLEMSAKPLGRKMVIDAMNLPLISSYAFKSVEDVIKGFIAPKSYTIDVAGLLGAGDGPSDVYAMGLIVIVIHQASNLAASDINGQSDPFVQASFARAGKPLFTTRVLTKTREPIWQETGFLLVSPDEIRDHERLRLTAFDADRFSSDDPLGKIEISIDRLIRKFVTGKWGESNHLLETRTDDLRPMRRGAAVQGNLKYSVGFFGFAAPEGPRRQAMLRKAVHKDNTQPKETNFASPQLSEKSQPFALKPDHGPSASEAEEDDDPLHQFMTPFDKFINRLGLPMDNSVLKKRRDRKERVGKLVKMIEGAKAATVEPPVPSHPAGIMAFHIHSIHNLEVPTTQRSYGNSKRLTQKARYSASGEGVLAEGTGAGRLPSSYVQVFLNDEAIFRTRTKTLNPRPYINGGSERFVGDWTTARIDFTVRDARMRESDPILGCAGLRLADVLKKSSRSTEWYTLTGGLGYGKIRITLLFRAIEIVIPRPLRGWNVGVMEVSKCRAVGLLQDATDSKGCHIMLETVGGKMETSNVEPMEEYESDANTVSYEWPLKEPIRFPVRQRYPNFLYIHLRSESRVPGRHNTHAHAVVPLNRITDDTLTPRRVPLLETSDWQRFEQDMLLASTNTDQLLSPQSDQDKPQMLPVLEELCQQGNQELPIEALSDGHIKRVGWLELEIVLHHGIGPEHRSCVAGDNEMRFAFDTYTALIEAGERSKPTALPRRRRASSSKPSGDTLKVDTNLARPGHRRILSYPEGSDSNIFAADPESDGNSLYAASATESEQEMQDTPEGKRARQKALHRQHRGAAQIKGFRTLSWLKTNAEDGVQRVKRQFDKQNKRIGKMESEGVSHF